MATTTEQTAEMEKISERSSMFPVVDPSDMQEVTQLFE